MKQRFRAWIMRTFGLVERSLYHDTLKALIEANDRTIAANYLAMNYGERLDAAEIEIRSLKARLWPLALTNALHSVKEIGNG